MAFNQTAEGFTENRALVLQRMLSDDFYFSPLKFVLFAYPWGEGDLKDFKGPRQWQRKVMLEIEAYLREAVVEKGKEGIAPDFYRHAISSGRGPGKSALVGMLAHWFISTRIGGSVWVSSNGEPQLRTKTFPEIAKWVARGINSEFFEINSMSIAPSTWFKNYIESPQGLGKSTRYYYISGQLWSKESPEAFAGAHNTDGEFAIFDEANAIPAEIWDVEAGVFTENIVDRFWLAFSNPRSNTGAFYDCFHKNLAQWRTTQIDSRSVEGINQAAFNSIIAQYGFDSDQVRVEILGEFPKAGEDIFISPSLVDEAMKRAPYVMASLDANDPDFYAPVVIGVDPARSGLDSTVIVVRKGRSIISLKRYNDPDTMIIVGRVIDTINEFDPDMTCIDVGGLGAGVYDRLKEQRYNVREVLFSWKSSNLNAFLNSRAEMWSKMRDWLLTARIPYDEIMKRDMTSVRRKLTSSGALQLESKRDLKARGGASPDAADAVAVTLYYDISSKTISKRPLRETGMESFRHFGGSAVSTSWMS